MVPPAAPNTDPNNAIPLPRLPRELRDRYGLHVSYGRLYRDALNGALPIEQSATGRYHATAAALPEIARLLGCAPTTQAA